MPLTTGELHSANDNKVIGLLPRLSAVSSHTPITPGGGSVSINSGGLISPDDVIGCLPDRLKVALLSTLTGDVPALLPASHHGL